MGQSGTFDKEGQYSQREIADNVPSITMPISPLTFLLTSFASSLKVDHTDNMPHENQQFANTNASGSNILFIKADLSAPYMIPKAAFAKKVDDNDSDFKHVICGRKRGASRLSAKDNQTQESVMGSNVTELPCGQRLSGIKLSRKN